MRTSRRRKSGKKTGARSHAPLPTPKHTSSKRSSKKEVARDVVIVDVRGPHYENLTLIDLPGIVRTVGKEESQTLAGDIQSLLNDYLANPLCIILAVLPCNVDFHNSQIMSDAKRVDPYTKRTLPVLTKPDLIDGGGEAGVKELLLGMKTESFELGFHMSKGWFVQPLLHFSPRNLYAQCLLC